MADTTRSEVLDWDETYREEGAFAGNPPWNIGVPQPELAELIRKGKMRGDVLDAGCGHGELALSLAADGHVVVGIDLSPTAVAAAGRAAHQRDLSNVTFVRDDITTFTGYDGRFATIVDSTLFHSLPVQARDAYQQSVFRAAAPGAVYYVLVFAKSAFDASHENAPNAVTEDELRAVVGCYWAIGDVRPAFIHANMAALPDFAPDPAHPFDDEGRVKLPAFLLTAHKPG